MTVEAEPGTRWTKVTQLVITVVAVTAIPWVVWATSRIHSMDLSIVKLETFASAGGRFTAEHGETLRLEIAAENVAENLKIWQEIAVIQGRWIKEISVLNTQIATLPQTMKIPPIWWEEYVKTEFARQHSRISDLEKAIDDRK